MIGQSSRFETPCTEWHTLDDRYYDAFTVYSEAVIGLMRLTGSAYAQAYERAENAKLAYQQAEDLMRCHEEEHCRPESRTTSTSA